MLIRVVALTMVLLVSWAGFPGLGGSVAPGASVFERGGDRTVATPSRDEVEIDNGEPGVATLPGEPLVPDLTAADAHDPGDAAPPRHDRVAAAGEASPARGAVVRRPLPHPWIATPRPPPRRA